jgi:hypothetical protein
VKKKFLILAYPYQHNSGGITCLHELCDALVRSGCEAHLLFVDSKSGQVKYLQNPELFHPNLLRCKVNASDPKPYLLDLIQNGIVVYPEIIVGNPLNARHVVRYFLNGDGVVTGRKSNYSDRDFCLAFSEKFFDNPHAILNKPFIHESFHQNDSPSISERKLDLTYVGKGRTHGKCFRVKDSFEITRQYPATKEELALILRNSRYFFSWDNLSSTNTDALLCGAQLVLLQDKPLDRAFLQNWDSEFGRLPFHKGIVQGDQVRIEINPDYERLRVLYLAKVHKALDAWPAAVKETAQKIFHYFEQQDQSIG